MKGQSSILLSGALFGTVGLFIKLATQGTTAADLLFIRLSLSAMICLCILLAVERGKRFKPNKQELLSFIVLGLLTIGSMGFFVFSLYYTSVANAILIIYVFPVITAFFAMHFLHEKVTKFTWMALTVSILGVIVLAYNDFVLGSIMMIGNLLALCSAFCTASATILIRHEERICPVDMVSFWPIALAAVFFMPLAWAEGGGTIIISRGIALPLIALGLVTAFAHYSYNYALKFIEAHTTTILCMITEVSFSILLAFIFLGEAIGLNVFIGGALILAAGLFVQFELNAKVGSLPQ